MNLFLLLQKRNSSNEKIYQDNAHTARGVCIFILELYIVRL